MLTIKTFFELTGYELSEGCDYNCTQSNAAYNFDYWNGKHSDGGFSIACIFDCATQDVIMMEVCDYALEKAFRWKNEKFEFDENDNTAWEEVDYIDIIEEDFMEKATAIIEGREYDQGILIPIELTQSELVAISLAAHKLNVTLNQFMIDAVTEQINSQKAYKDQGG